MRFGVLRGYLHGSGGLREVSGRVLGGLWEPQGGLGRVSGSLRDPHRGLGLLSGSSRDALGTHRGRLERPWEGSGDRLGGLAVLQGDPWRLLRASGGGALGAYVTTIGEA